MKGLMTLRAAMSRVLSSGAGTVLLLLAAGGEVAAPLLPNLAMAPIRDVRVTEREGRDQLRFSATVANLGEGPFELRSVRPARRGPWTVQQRITDPEGGATYLPTAARLVFARDGHGHWHVRDLAYYEIRRRGDGALLRRNHKQGFCFYDTDRVAGRAHPGPRSPRYREASCGGPRSRGLTTGISAGWGDRYSWRLTDQFIDVTGLPAGVYRVSAVADHPGLFAERDESDNGTWIDVRLTHRAGAPQVRVVGRPPPRG
jgi:hypothetical protein